MQTITKETIDQKLQSLSEEHNVSIDRLKGYYTLSYDRQRAFIEEVVGMSFETMKLNKPELYKKANTYTMEMAYLDVYSSILQTKR